MGRPDDETTPASHPLFNPPQAETDVGTLREGTNWLWDLTGRIVGRSGDMRSVVTGAAMEFSDLVTQDISESGEYNDALWRKTCMNIAFAAGVGDQWADDVIDYKSDRAQLVAQFQTAIDSGPSNIDNSTAGTAESMRRANLIRQFQIRAENRLEELNETGRERKRMLKDGPEPAHVAKLVDSGALGWAAYNIRGPGENPPLPVTKEQADGMAADLRPYLRGDKEPDARYFEIVSTLAAITNKAVVLQGRDRADLTPQQRLRHNNLRSGEIEFLRSFYAGLEEQHTRGILYLPEDLAPQTNNGQGLERDTSDPVREETWAALANGLLVLSDPELGGSYDYLPPSIQRFADGEPYPNNAPGATHSSEENARAWMREAEDFERLLGRAHPELQGGTDFSANVTASAGHHLNAIGKEEHQWDGSLSSLLEVTTRNEQANHRLLSDDRNYDHPTFGGAGNAIKGLYTHEWEDDGAGVGGLTDWIAEAAHSGDDAREGNARDAALGLIRMTTDDPDRYDALINTGVTVERDGEKYSDASFGIMNPRIAQSLANVVVNYQDDFGMPAPGRESSGFEGYGTNPTSGRMELGYEPRLKFLEFVAADPDSAAQIYHSLDLREEISSAALAAGGTDPSPEGLQNGTLRALLDNAMRMEALDRTDNETDTRQALADSRKAVQDSLFNIARTASYAGTGYLGLGAEGIKAANRIAGGFMIAGVGAHEFNDRVLSDAETVDTAYQDANGPGESDGRTYTESGFGMRSRIDMINYLVNTEDSGVTVDTVRERAPELLTESGDVRTHSDFTAHDGLDTAGGSDALTTRMDRILTEAHRPFNVPGSDAEDGALPVLQDYESNYGSGYNDTQEGIRATIGPDRADELRQLDGSGEHPDD